MRYDPIKDIAEFHRAIGVESGKYPGLQRPDLRARLIEEEARETVSAIRNHDMIGAIDGMCDLLVVTYGTADEFGIYLPEFWAEVHSTNMAKAGGPIREDGKALKPEGWQPPNIEGVLQFQMRRAESHRRF